MTTTHPPHLKALEAESIHILREVAAQAARPVLLYSIGKDSSVLLHLARKAFFPAPPPFPLLHIDTTWKFRDMITLPRRHGEAVRLRSARAHQSRGAAAEHQSVRPRQQHLHPGDEDRRAEAGADRGQIRRRDRRRAARRGALARQGTGVLGARSGHSWDPKRQRPELWHLYNGNLAPGETLRVFPLSNWTELDVWTYILAEGIDVVPLYFAAPRPTVERDGLIIVVDDDRMQFRPGETPVDRLVRFRSLGCYPLSAAVESSASNLEEIVAEMRTTRVSERAGRLIDQDQDASMEKKKREGYF